MSFSINDIFGTKIMTGLTLLALLGINSMPVVAATTNTEPSVTFTLAQQSQQSVPIDQHHRLVTTVSGQTDKHNKAFLTVKRGRANIATNSLAPIAEDIIDWPSNQTLVSSGHCDLTGDNKDELLLLSQTQDTKLAAKLQLSALSFNGERQYQLIPVAELKPTFTVKAKPSTSRFALLCHPIDGNLWADVTVVMLQDNQLSGYLIANISPSLAGKEIKPLPMLSHRGIITGSEWLGVAMVENNLQLWKKPTITGAAQLVDALDSAQLFGRTAIIAGELQQVGDASSGLSKATIRSLMAVRISSYRQLRKYLAIAKTDGAKVSLSSKKVVQKLAQLHPKLAPPVINELVAKLTTK